MQDGVFKENLPIEFHFQPYFADGAATNTVEKADTTGKKRMYIEGIASGPKIDMHEERMTEKAIGSFMTQANSGNVLLYPDNHGIRASQDIGILTKAEISPDGQWRTSFRLYDEDDGVDQASVETAKKIWKQLNGLPPYRKPLKKGFSIEGYIPPNGILSSENDGMGNVRKRVIDDVMLDGVILCPRPAYQDSIATAVYKALGEMNPYKRDKVQKNIRNALQSVVQEKELHDEYYRQKWDIQAALEKEIESVMKKPDLDKREQLEILFTEFKAMMINLLMSSESLFKETEDDLLADDSPYEVGVNKAAVSELERYRGILKSFLDFKKIHKL